MNAAAAGTAQRRVEWGPLILDDQAILLHVQDKGLVVLTGCGHAGIVNTVRYAQKLTGLEQIYAIIGGFHLGGMTPEPLIQQQPDNQARSFGFRSTR